MTGIGSDTKCSISVTIWGIGVALQQGSHGQGKVREK